MLEVNPNYFECLELFTCFNYCMLKSFRFSRFTRHIYLVCELRPNKIGIVIKIIRALEIWELKFCNKKESVLIEIKFRVRVLGTDSKQFHYQLETTYIIIVHKF